MAGVIVMLFGALTGGCYRYVIRPFRTLCLGFLLLVVAYFVMFREIQFQHDDRTAFGHGHAFQRWQRV